MWFLEVVSSVSRNMQFANKHHEVTLSQETILHI